MKGLFTIVILSLIIGFLLGHFVFPPAVPTTPPVVVAEDSLRVLQDTINVYTERIDSLENVLLSIPEPSPRPLERKPYPSSIEDSLKVYAAAYSKLYKKYMMTKAENEVLKRAIEVRDKKIELLESSLEEVNIQLSYEKERVRRLKKRMFVGFVAVVVGVLLLK